MWCPPCWNYHQDHHLETLWQEHGPLGAPRVNHNSTDDVVVLWVEGYANTPESAITGVGGNTIRDWSDGVSYPLIDLASVASSYSINAFPSFFVICPNRQTWNVYGNAQQLYNLVGSCPQVSEGENMGILFYTGETQTCGDKVNCSITVQNKGSEVVNGFTAKVMDGNNELASETISQSIDVFDIVDIDFGTLTINGQVNLEIILSDDDLASDNVFEQMIEALPESENNLTVQVTTDNFGADCSWAIENENGVEIASGGPYANHSNTTTFVIQQQEDQDITIPAGGCYILKVYDTQGDGMYYYEPTFVRIVDSNNQLVADIQGEDYQSEGETYFKVGGDLASVIDNQIEASWSIYPNPAQNELNIVLNEDVDHIEIVDILGKTVLNISLENNISQNIDVSSLQNGIYFVKTYFGKKISSKKFIILR